MSKPFVGCSVRVYFNVYDEMGTVTYEGEAFQGGVPSVITAGDLEADTTYYISVVSPNSSASRDYTLTVKDPTAPAPEIVSTGEELVPGDSMYTAGSIPLGKKVPERLRVRRITTGIPLPQRQKQELSIRFPA